MGLFGNSKPKKLCPLCGNPTSWFLPTKVEGQPVCDDCGGKIAGLPDDIRNSATERLDSVQKYLDFAAENQALRSRFKETFRYEFGFIEGCICLDLGQRLLRLGKEKASVFEPKHFTRFRILEDQVPLFEGTSKGLICYHSTAPDKVRGMDREIERFQLEQRRVEHLRRMEEQRERRAKERGQNYIADYISEPSVDLLNPFQKYVLKIELDLGFGKLENQFKKDGPSFSSFTPSIERYLTDYEAAAKDMRALADKLMAVMNPNAPVRQAGGPTKAASGFRKLPIIPTAPKDPVVEIQRYKALLDSGAITEEEFTAKKRQLLGI